MRYNTGLTAAPASPLYGSPVCKRSPIQVLTVLNAASHHAEGLVNPKVRAQKRSLILDTPEHVDLQNIKLKIGFRSSAYQLFSKCDLTVPISLAQHLFLHGKSYFWPKFFIQPPETQ
jgi:hypothetical protein